MSISNWNAGIIRPVAVAPTGPYANGTAPGVWTLDQQAFWAKQGLWPTAGNTNPDAFIENLFSTWLYNGTGANQTITNGIDLSTKGGLVWIKARTQPSFTSSHAWIDTLRGTGKLIYSNLTGAEQTYANTLTSFNSNGFSLGADSSDGTVNWSGHTYVSWTFRDQAKFFDVVTWTGNGSDPRNISHSLGSVPGCIIIKCTSTGATDWFVYHRSLGNTQSLNLNQTGAAETGTAIWGSTTPTSTVFTVGNINSNTNGRTYVAYLFAHDAGGFGTSGNDNVISCSSFVGTGSDLSVNLGYEPQWLLVKRASSGTDNWRLYDNMRGMFANFDDNVLFPNTAGAEVEGLGNLRPTATGFDVAGSFPASGVTYIYVAIRRGPMAVPTDATKVFAPLAVNNATGTVNTTNFPIDLQMQFYRPGGISPGTSQWIDRLRGFSSTSTGIGTRLYTTGTQAEAATAIGTLFNNTGFSTGSSWASVSMSYNNLRRAPSFFDEVCYTGTGSARTVTHNLAAVPELMIVKSRDPSGNDWIVYASPLGNQAYLQLNRDYAATTSNPIWNNTTPTSSVFSVGTAGDVNGSGNTQVAYLFATCPGVSKVGSYTGTGAAQTINCGFVGGARYVLIKRTDSTGDWYVWDSARGLIPANDPYLLLNSTAAEVTGTDYVDTTAVGFDITSTAPAAINANGGSFIFLAIA